MWNIYTWINSGKSAFTFNNVHSNPFSRFRNFARDSTKWKLSRFELVLKFDCLREGLKSKPARSPKERRFALGAFNEIILKGFLRAWRQQMTYSTFMLTHFTLQIEDSPSMHKDKLNKCAAQNSYFQSLSIQTHTAVRKIFPL